MSPQFAILRDNLAETPRKELVKVVSFLWNARWDIAPGECKDIGQFYKITLFRTEKGDNFFFLLSGVNSNDDTTTIAQIFNEVTSDAL